MDYLKYLTMNTLFKAALVLGLFVWTTTSYGQSTVTGEVADLKCYLGSGALGPDHAKCAKSCISAGQPMGLVTTDGKVYLLGIGKDKSQYESLKELAGESVEVSGKVSQKDGLNIVVVESARKSEG
jgi:hypothetical protein